MVARFWSTVPLMAILLLIVVTGVESRWLVPRALQAQRLLIDQRRELGRAPTLAGLERRLRARLEQLPTRRPELEAALDHAAARARSMSSARAGGAGGELSRAGTVLDTYIAALENLEIDALLVPELWSTDEPRERLEQAIGLLAASPARAP